MSFHAEDADLFYLRDMMRQQEITKYFLTIFGLKHKLFCCNFNVLVVSVIAGFNVVVLVVITVVVVPLAMSVVVVIGPIVE